MNHNSVQIDQTRTPSSEREIVSTEPIFPESAPIWAVRLFAKLEELESRINGREKEQKTLLPPPPKHKYTGVLKAAIDRKSDVKFYALKAHLSQQMKRRVTALEIGGAIVNMVLAAMPEPSEFRSVKDVKGWVTRSMEGIS